MKLDLRDFKILHELGLNSRQTNSEIGKKVGISQQAVSYRIKQLLDKKIITEFFTVINFGFFGYASYIAMVKLNKISKQEKQKIITNISMKKNVLLISECGGQWDLIVDIVAKTPLDFQEIISKFIEKFREVILNYDLFLSVGGSGFGRKYLYDKKKDGNIVSFGKEAGREITEIESKILQIVSKNARLSSTEIGDKLKVNYKTVINHLKEMEKEGIISGFRPFIDITKLGYSSSKIYLDLNKLTQKGEKEFIDFLSSKKNIIGILKMIGKWNFSVGIETKNQQETWELYNEIQNFLGDKIKSIELIPIFKKHEYNYFCFV